MAKDFSNLTTGRAMQKMQTAQDTLDEKVVQDNQEVHVEHEAQKKRKDRKSYNKQEAQEILNSGRNARGLGGVKMPRINMAFSPQNYDFIKVLSRVRGQSGTDFVNHLVDMYREQNKEQYEQAKAFLNSL